VKLLVAADAADAARRAAERIETALRRGLRAHAAAAVALSGGHTPGPMLRELFGRPLAWDRIRVFQVDERVAPAGSRERNRTLLEESARDGAPGALGALRPIPLDGRAPEQAAAAYEALLLREVPRGFDAVHLGLGADGHTASWPPGDPVLAEVGEGARRVAVVGPYRGRIRITLTPRAVAESARVVFLVVGAAKAPALERLLRDDPALPASRVPRRRTVVVADPEAASFRAGPRSPGRGRDRAR